MDTLFSDVFQQAAAGIAIVNVDGSFRHVNAKFCSLIGYTEEELKQLTFADITHSDDLYLDQANIVKVLAGEIDAFQIEKRYLHKDGRSIWIMLHSNVKRDAAGQIEYAVATVTDISARKLAEMQQKDEQRRIRYMVDQQKAGILLLESVGEWGDPEHTLIIKEMNPAFCKLFQASAEEWIGQDLSKIGLSAQNLEFFDRIQQALRTGTTVYTPTRHYIQNDHHFWFESYISILPNGEIMLQVIDVAAEVEARNEILNERDRAQSYFDVAGVMLLILDAQGNIASINQHGAHVLGGTKNELIGRNWFRNFLFPEDQEEIETFFTEKVLTGNMQFHHRAEHRIRTMTGQARFISWTNASLRDASGKIYGSLSSGEDVTEQRKLIHELQLINKVIENSLNGFSIIDRYGRFSFANNAYVEMWGYDSAAEIIGTPASRHCVNPGDMQPLIATLIEEGKEVVEFEALRKDGTSFDALMYAWIDQDNAGNRIFAATAIDITEQKQARIELENSREQLRQLANHIQNAREAERQHLSREMHDQFGQILSGLRMDISWLGKHPDDPEKIESRLKGMEDLVDQAIKITRQIASDLRPGILDDLGLFAALEWFSEEFERRSGIRINLTLPEEEPQIQPEVVTALFRIYQEALTNVYRHAQATQIEAILTEQDQMLSLCIQDNGKGISAEDQQRSDSYGVLGMYERATILNGQVEITSQPGDGTRIMVSIPNQPQNEKPGSA